MFKLFRRNKVKNKPSRWCAHSHIKTTGAELVSLIPKSGYCVDCGQVMKAKLVWTPTKDKETSHYFESKKWTDQLDKIGVTSMYLDGDK